MHIRHIREKIEINPKEPRYLKVVWGVGYKIEDNKWLQEKYTEKRNLFLGGLDDLNIRHTVPQGAYYILLDISEFGYDSDLEFCEVLARDVGVGAVPGQCGMQSVLW